MNKQLTIEHAFHLDLGFAIGKIPLWVAKKIGVKNYNPLSLSIKLRKTCSYRVREGEDELPF